MSRVSKISGANGNTEKRFPCAADQVQNWQLYTVDPYCAEVLTTHTCSRSGHLSAYHHTAAIIIVVLLIKYIWFCACVCVAIPFIMYVRLVDGPAGVTQEEGRT